jgi:hypothetical protein
MGDTSMVRDVGDIVMGLVADKKRLRQQMDGINRALGRVHDPKATAELSKEMILKDGVNPEDRLFSCGIISARDED